MMTVQEWLGEDNQLGIDIWNKKYRWNNESFEEWLNRVSGGDQELRQLIIEKKFMFGGRITANRGTNKKASMMNCYSRGFVEDSLDDILQVNSDIAKTFKAQGGQGLSLSKLRPKGTGINNGQFTSDGIVPFMEMFNRTTESISQGGSRKGALLMGIDIWHKESEEFIKIKSEEGRIQKANLSLEIDDQFMEDVKKYYDSAKIITRHIKRNYEGNIVEYDITPIKLYKLMIEKAWDWGEPGCIFTNRFRNYNLMEFVDSYNIEICNPCGEQPLGKNSACDLGSINLSEFVSHPFEKKAYFDYEKFGEAVKIGVRSLDLIIDENQNNHALDVQKQQSLKFRNIGLGVMGVYDCLIKLGMIYGEEDSIALLDNIMQFMFREAFKASVELAKTKGSFPEFDYKLFDSEIVREHFSRSELEDIGAFKYGLRNCSLLSIAPTGSIGTMLNISTGCEPAFNIFYTRKTESLNHDQDTYYKVYVDIAKEFFKSHRGITELPDDLFVTAGDIDWHKRIDLQSALQKHVDTAISSTVNLKHEITLEEVESLYLYAWEKGLKGITIFRDGCRRTGILTNTNNDTDKQEDQHTTETLKRGMIIVADDNCIGRKRKLNTGCGSLHLLAYFDSETGDLLECFLSKGSTGGCANSLTGVSRMISLAARGGIDIYSIVDQLKSCGSCPSYAVRSATKHDTSKGSSCPVAVGNALLEMYKELQAELSYDEIVKERPVKTVAKPKTDEDVIKKDIACPECGGNAVFQGGCVVCPDCGWSRCE